MPKPAMPMSRIPLAPPAFSSSSARAASDESAPSVEQLIKLHRIRVIAQQVIEAAAAVIAGEDVEAEAAEFVLPCPIFSRGHELAGDPLSFRFGHHGQHGDI